MTSPRALQWPPIHSHTSGCCHAGHRQHHLEELAFIVLPKGTTADWEGAGIEPPVTGRAALPPELQSSPVKTTLTASLFFSPLLCFPDLRQELAVRERQTDVSRMSAPSSPTQDGVKSDSSAQASLSLPATPLCKTLDNAFANQTGQYNI